MKKNTRFLKIIQMFIVFIFMFSIFSNSANAQFGAGTTGGVAAAAAGGGAATISVGAVLGIVGGAAAILAITGYFAYEKGWFNSDEYMFLHSVANGKTDDAVDFLNHLSRDELIELICEHMDELLENLNKKRKEITGDLLDVSEDVNKEDKENQEEENAIKNGESTDETSRQEAARESLESSVWSETLGELNATFDKEMKNAAKDAVTEDYDDAMEAEKKAEQKEAAKKAAEELQGIVKGFKKQKEGSSELNDNTIKQVAGVLNDPDISQKDKQRLFNALPDFIKNKVKQKALLGLKNHYTKLINNFSKFKDKFDALCDESAKEGYTHDNLITAVEILFEYDLGPKIMNGEAEPGEAWKRIMQIWEGSDAISGEDEALLFKMAVAAANKLNEARKAAKGNTAAEQNLLEQECSIYCGLLNKLGCDAFFENLNKQDMKKARRVAEVLSECADKNIGGCSATDCLKPGSIAFKAATENLLKCNKNLVNLFKKEVDKIKAMEDGDAKNDAINKAKNKYKKLAQKLEEEFKKKVKAKESVSQDVSDKIKQMNDLVNKLEEMEDAVIRKLSLKVVTSMIPPEAHINDALDKLMECDSSYIDGLIENLVKKRNALLNDNAEEDDNKKKEERNKEIEKLNDAIKKVKDSVDKVKDCLEKTKNDLNNNPSKYYGEGSDVVDNKKLKDNLRKCLGKEGIREYVGVLGNGENIGNIVKQLEAKIDALSKVSSNADPGKEKDLEDPKGTKIPANDIGQTSEPAPRPAFRNQITQILNEIRACQTEKIDKLKEMLKDKGADEGDKQLIRNTIAALEKEKAKEEKKLILIVNRRLVEINKKIEKLEQLLNGVNDIPQSNIGNGQLTQLLEGIKACNVDAEDLLKEAKERGVSEADANAIKAAMKDMEDKVKRLEKEKNTLEAELETEEDDYAPDEWGPEEDKEKKIKDLRDKIKEKEEEIKKYKHKLEVLQEILDEYTDYATFDNKKQFTGLLVEIAKCNIDAERLKVIADNYKLNEKDRKEIEKAREKIKEEIKRLEKEKEEEEDKFLNSDNVDSTSTKLLELEEQLAKYKNKLEILNQILEEDRGQKLIGIITLKLKKSEEKQTEEQAEPQETPIITSSEIEEPAEQEQVYVNGELQLSEEAVSLLRDVQEDWSVLSMVGDAFMAAINPIPGNDIISDIESLVVSETELEYPEQLYEEEQQVSQEPTGDTDADGIPQEPTTPEEPTISYTQQELETVEYLLERTASGELSAVLELNDLVNANPGLRDTFEVLNEQVDNAYMTLFENYAGDLYTQIGDNIFEMKMDVSGESADMLTMFDEAITGEDNTASEIVNTYSFDAQVLGNDGVTVLIPDCMAEESVICGVEYCYGIYNGEAFSVDAPREDVVSAVTTENGFSIENGQLVVEPGQKDINNYVMLFKNPISRIVPLI